MSNDQDSLTDSSISCEEKDEKQCVDLTESIPFEIILSEFEATQNQIVNHLMESSAESQKHKSDTKLSKTMKLIELKSQKDKAVSLTRIIYDITTNWTDESVKKDKNALLLCLPIFTTSYNFLDCLTKRFFAAERNPEMLSIFIDDNHNYKQKCFYLVHGYISQIELLLSSKYFINTIPEIIVDLCCQFYIIDDKPLWQTHITVISTIQDWMRCYWDEDFGEDDSHDTLFGQVETFCDKMEVYYKNDTDMTEIDIKKFKKLIKMLYHTMDYKQMKTRLRRIASQRVQLLPQLTRIPNPFIYDNTTLAEQITLMTDKLFKAIMKREFIVMEQKLVTLNVIQLNDQICQWVQATVLQSETAESQGKLITKFIRISDELLVLRNFQSLYAIYAGLSSLQKLKHAWKHVSDKYVMNYKRIKVIFNPENNSHNLRQLQFAAHMPLIPYVKVFMSDVKVILDDIGDETNDINLPQLRRLAQFIENISHVQKASIYIIKENLVLQKMLSATFFKFDFH